MTRTPSGSTPDLTGVVVLVIDDHDDIRDLLTELLKDAGAVVDSASDTSTAVAAFLRRRPDVIVSDVGLPGENGYDLLRRIRALDGDPGPPSLALTAYAQPEDRLRAQAAGFQRFAAKPVDSSEFLRLVAMLVGA